jgi:hypothetical protein
MSKKKSFKDWFQEETDREFKFKKQDGKRYDRKKAAIQKARKQKNKQKNSYFS